ncbi:MAG: M28 family peptidase [candidate division Zixibacteria bacterium]|nr:M28 family peptidase [candidate division Zixibacteria bacterium]
MIKVAICLLLVVGFFCASPVAAEVVFEVTIDSRETARLANEAQVIPILKTKAGYIVSSSTSAMELLKSQGLEIVVIAEETPLEQLARDIRFDDYNTSRYVWLFNDGDIRIAQVESSFWLTNTSLDGMAPLKILPVVITFEDTHIILEKRVKALVPDLESIIALINQDSLEYFTETLQAFNGRVAGTPSNELARDWIASEFYSFGYDSVVIDSFVETLGGSPAECQNVIAYKVGTTLPDHHIIIGAHRDAVNGSPGADDNGSGTAAVLEIARNLKNIDTDLTFIFVLFDAEEWGLYGSYHYVEEATANGDNIVYMFNLDMVGYYENTDKAKLFHGSNLGNALLCRQIADSLFGLDAVLSGTSGGSDHYPFQQYGYEATFLFEYIFSTVYHSPQDSTSYMNFNYMHKMVQLAAATVYSVDFNYIPDPGLEIQVVGGVPIVLSADTTNTIEVIVTGKNGGVPASGEAYLHYSIDDLPFNIIALNDLGNNQYQAEMPVLPCGSMIDFYFTAEETTFGTYYDINTATPHHALFLYFDSTLVVDDFNADLGWTTTSTATAGNWERSVPLSGSLGAPDTDYDGSGYCFLTDNSTIYADVDNGTVTLDSPPFDISSGYGVISFAQWFYNSNNGDHLEVWISGNGGSSFSPVSSYGSLTDPDGEWLYSSFISTDFINSSADMQLRFSTYDHDPQSTVEAAIDAVVISLYHSDPFSIYPSDLSETTVGIPFEFQLEDVNGIGDIAWLDMSDGLAGSGLELTSDGLLQGTPLVGGQVVFTAWAADQMRNSYALEFTLTVNDEVEILQPSGALLDAPVNEYYEFQFGATGGTGALVWDEVSGSLTGTGLSLSPGGLLSGTVTEDWALSLTVRATDELGSFDEHNYSVSFNTEYIFGDANGDSTVNVGDAVFVIQYAFKGGPAPDPLEAGDANCDSEVNVGDAVYIINYAFSGGPEPDCTEK